MRLFILLAAPFAVTLAACAPAADAPPPDASASSSAPQAPDAATYDLRGQWGVTRLSGQTLDMRIPFTGTREALVWQPDCAGQDIHYRTVGSMIEFHQPTRIGAREVCEIGYPEALPRVIDALEGRWNIAAQQNGDLLLSRGDMRLTLEKLPVDAPESLAGEWRVAGIDGKEFDEPYAIALSADDTDIWWEPRCARQSVHYRIVGERFVVVEPPAAPPPPPGAEPPPPPAVCAIGLPERLPEVMNAIRSANRIERTPANGVRLSGGGHSITLFAQ